MTRKTAYLTVVLLGLLALAAPVRAQNNRGFMSFINNLTDFVINLFSSNT